MRRLLHDSDDSAGHSSREREAPPGAVDASKVYGEGEAEVRALDHISVEFAAL